MPAASHVCRDTGPRASVRGCPGSLHPFSIACPSHQHLSPCLHSQPLFGTGSACWGPEPQLTGPLQRSPHPEPRPGPPWGWAGVGALWNGPVCLIVTGSVSPPALRRTGVLWGRFRTRARPSLQHAGQPDACLCRRSVFRWVILTASGSRFTARLLAVRRRLSSAQRGRSCQRSVGSDPVSPPSPVKAFSSRM